MYCKSGMAYGDGDTATCVSTSGIRFGEELAPEEEHWPCDPTDPYKKCKIFFEKTDTSEESFEVDCKCSLSNNLKETDPQVTALMSEEEKQKNNEKSAPGYCSSVIGLFCIEDRVEACNFQSASETGHWLFDISPKRFPMTGLVERIFYAV